ELVFGAGAPAPALPAFELTGNAVEANEGEVAPGEEAGDGNRQDAPQAGRPGDDHGGNDGGDGHWNAVHEQSKGHGFVGQQPGENTAGDQQGQAHQSFGLRDPTTAEPPD